MQEGVLTAPNAQLRAGSKSLSIFSYSLNADVLRAHADGPLRSCELEEKIGWAPQSSLRSAAVKLCDIGALGRLGPLDGAQSAATELTEAGRELLPVAAVLERWLQLAPGGPLPLESAAARGIVRVLTAGWDSTMVRTMAERPLTLNEMSAGIPELSYPALKRRLAKLRSTRLVTPVSQDKGTAYSATDWLRLAVVPLAVAGQWERRHDPEAEPISRMEVEAAFLLTLPFVELAAGTSGSCTLAVLTSDDRLADDPEVAGVAVAVEDGKVASCASESSSTPTTWALGTTNAWLDAVIDGDAVGLRASGAKPSLAQEIVTSLHERLFRT